MGRTWRPSETELSRMRSMSCAIRSRGAFGARLTLVRGTEPLALSSATAYPVTMAR